MDRYDEREREREKYNDKFHTLLGSRRVETTTTKRRDSNFLIGIGIHPPRTFLLLLLLLSFFRIKLLR